MRNEASRTAVLACQGRAAAHDRIAVGRFSDPIAISLLDEDERLVVDHVRDDAPPKGLAARMTYEFVRGCASLMAPRTVAIDDAIRDGVSEQLVVLGAGLDARAWRMDELAGTVAFEVDHPATQADKRVRLADTPPRAAGVRFVATDFTRQALASDLERAGHRTGVPTTWVWEGVVPYLTSEPTTNARRASSASRAPQRRAAVRTLRSRGVPFLGQDELPFDLDDDGISVTDDMRVCVDPRPGRIGADRP